MKTSREWFEEYAESHRHPVNKLIHWICVPAIMLSLLGLLYTIPIVLYSNEENDILINLAHLAVVFALVFYVRMSFSIFVGMLLISYIMLMFLPVMAIKVPLPLWLTSLIIFVLAWVGQFIGHKIEGKKPSFLKDLQFLLVGPAWLLHFIYRSVGIRY